MIAALAFAVLVQTGPEVQVVAPPKPNEATPATLVVEPAAMLIVACDTDRSGDTSRPELEHCLARSFGDKPLRYLDFAVWQQRWLGDQGALPSPFELDRDGDERVSPEELLAGFNRIFVRLDRSGDAAVTRAEALTLRAMPTADPAGRDKRRGQRVPGGRPEAPRTP